MRPGGVVVLLVFGQDSSQVRFAEDELRSRSSRRRVPTRCSQIAFFRGACTAVRKIVVPVAWKTASKERVKFDPWSRIKNRKSSNRSPRNGSSTMRSSFRAAQDARPASQRPEAAGLPARSPA
jgi:hypothetical protein